MKTPSFTSCRLSSDVWQQRIWITRPSSSSAAFVWAHPQKRSQSYSVGQMFGCTKKRHLCVKRRRHSGSNCFPLLLKCQTFRPPSHRSTRMEPKGRNSEWGVGGGVDRNLHRWTLNAAVCRIFLQFSRLTFTEAAQRLNSYPTGDCFHGGWRARPHVSQSLPAPLVLGSSDAQFMLGFLRQHSSLSHTFSHGGSTKYRHPPVIFQHVLLILRFLQTPLLGRWVGACAPHVLLNRPHPRAQMSFLWRRAGAWFQLKDHQPLKITRRGFTARSDTGWARIRNTSAAAAREANGTAIQENTD